MGDIMELVRIFTDSHLERFSNYKLVRIFDNFN